MAMNLSGAEWNGSLLYTPSCAVPLHPPASRKRNPQGGYGHKLSERPEYRIVAIANPRLLKRDRIQRGLLLHFE